MNQYHFQYTQQRNLIGGINGGNFMYSYIYDSFLNQKKYERVLSKVENEITDLEIKGRICRLTLLNTIKATIEDEIRRGAQTIVIVGNDKTISRALDVIAPKNITLGIIPIGGNNSIANMLGIPKADEACKILSARIIKNINLGKVNESYFIYNASIKINDLILQCDNRYNITLPSENNNCHNIRVYNPREDDDTPNHSSTLVTEIHTETQGRFFKIFKSKPNSKSKININTLAINNKENTIPIVMDGQKIIKSPAVIQKADCKLKVIVGKGRKL